MKTSEINKLIQEQNSIKKAQLHKFHLISLYKSLLESWQSGIYSAERECWRLGVSKKVTSFMYELALDTRAGVYSKSNAIDYINSVDFINDDTVIDEIKKNAKANSSPYKK